MIRLYLPTYPYRPVELKPGILRRLGLRTTPFAKMSEVAKAYPVISHARRH